MSDNPSSTYDDVFKLRITTLCVFFIFISHQYGFQWLNFRKDDLDTLSASCMSLGTEQVAHLFGLLLHTNYVIQGKTNAMYLGFIWCNTFYMIFIIFSNYFGLVK